MNKRRNESADFVGMDRLKTKHAAQVEKFLYKCAKSLKLLGFEEEFESVREYALSLIRAGLNFMYGSRDCASIFLK